MKCPHHIEPHQIQGLDFIHIYPVIQWLVKKAIEAKEEAGDLIQAYSTFHFDSHHQLPQDAERNRTFSKGLSAYSQLKSLSNPQRLFRRQEDVVLEEESARVHCSLLEYGWSVASASEAGRSSLDEEERRKHGETEAELSSQLLGEMSEITVPDVKLSAATVASLMDTKRIQEMALVYAKKEDERNVGGYIPIREYQLPSLNNSISDLTTDKDFLINRLTELKSELAVCDNEFQRLQDRYENMRAECSEYVEESRKLDELEATVDKESVDKVKELMVQHDEIKRREQEYKDRCRKEMADTKAEILKLKQQSSMAGPAETEARKREIRKEFEAERSRFSEVRLNLADLNKQIAALQRKIDEVPSMIELNQYQRRFLELYNQVASKHRETKQFYTLFNTLQDVKTYMAKEISLLDSACSQYSVAMSGERYKQEFLKQLEQILEGVKQNQIRVEKKHTEEKLRRDQLRETYQEMLDKQRLYYKTVKEFQEVCSRNEILSGKIKELEMGERSEDD